jgi:hypothetical protein
MSQSSSNRQTFWVPERSAPPLSTPTTSPRFGKRFSIVLDRATVLDIASGVRRQACAGKSRKRSLLDLDYFALQ